MDALEAQQALADGVSKLVSSQDWQHALDVASRFHRYSWGNTLLISMQRPDASRVAGFRRWQTMSRFVRKGEKGIAILAPLTYRRTVERDGERVDVVGVRGFRTAYVFDVSQTDGADLPDDVTTFCTRLQDTDGAEVYDLLAGALQARGWSVDQDDAALSLMGAECNGQTEYEKKRVTVRSTLAQRQKTKTLAHEYAHALLHSPTATSDRALAECEAESAAYIVLSVLGFDAGAYSFGYVASWSNGKVERVLDAGKNALRAAQTILQSIGANGASEESQLAEAA